MLNNEAQAATTIVLNHPEDAANTAAATGPWVDVREYVGDLLIIQQVGPLTGNITGKIQTATDGSGTGARDIHLFTNVAAANNLQTVAIAADSVDGWIRYTGTITTGPAMISSTASGRKKIV